MGIAASTHADAVKVVLDKKGPDPVVYTLTLHCDGLGNCKRMCGGIGTCLPTCPKAGMKSGAKRGSCGCNLFAGRPPPQLLAAGEAFRDALPGAPGSDERARLRLSHPP